MIINDLYQTRIDITKGTSGSSYYNVGLDATDVTVTVLLVDFNNNPVGGKNVTLSVTKGYFTKNGDKTLGGTSYKSISATTDSLGKITATYTASERGLITFSANNTTISIEVTGWKNVDSDNSAVWSSVAGTGVTHQKVYTNGELAVLYLTGTTYPSATTDLIGEIPDWDYAPPHNVFSLCTNSQEVWVYLRNDGNIYLRTKADKQSYGLIMMYPIKTKLALW